MVSAAFVTLVTRDRARLPSRLEGRPLPVGRGRLRHASNVELAEVLRLRADTGTSHITVCEDRPRVSGHGVCLHLFCQLRDL